MHKLKRRKKGNAIICISMFALAFAKHASLDEVKLIQDEHLTIYISKMLIFCKLAAFQMS